LRFASGIVWAAIGPRRHRVLEGEQFIRSDLAVDQGAPRRHEEGYGVRQWHFPDQGDVQLATEQQIPLIDSDQDRPDCVMP